MANPARKKKAQKSAPAKKAAAKTKPAKPFVRPASKPLKPSKAIKTKTAVPAFKAKIKAKIKAKVKPKAQATAKAKATAKPTAKAKAKPAPKTVLKTVPKKVLQKVQKAKKALTKEIPVPMPKKISKPAPEAAPKAKAAPAQKAVEKAVEKTAAKAPAKTTSPRIAAEEEAKPVIPVVTGYTADFLAKQKQRLIDLRDHLRDQMHGVAQDTLRVRAEGSEASAFGMHQADAGSDAYDKDFALSLLSQEQDALYEIEEGLKRVELSTYGVCEMSNKAIPKVRLEAIPHARFTVECQAQLERENKGRRRWDTIPQFMDSAETITDEEDDSSEEDDRRKEKE